MGLARISLKCCFLLTLFLFFWELHTLSGLAIHNNSNNVGNCKIYSLTDQFWICFLEITSSSLINFKI
jgi:hypothetical protein